ncbi:lactoylglutathione lyase-like lyase [Desulfitobacterium dehalogenans ATCC 51507]|uniref:Lactoylglutathione lyase-like lyase n=1 Tax=Desulfitobacterium dehalogenans (strain ATCC 51507 / DSM 9161 / JW/IU-DC1) TaxID=756499 RepID=I4A6W4_DESDJ|nr:VOC family protein [Desulfitobacterium dehalogenans]AFL99698.1 lactoylglutathione lyase-like lyase [Desulfitobacterium dehalogenans ATCC 51507]
MSEKKMFQGLAHIGIKSMNMDQAAAFYSEVLGFELLERIKPGDVELIFMKCGETVVELIEINDQKKFEDGVVNHLALRVEDIFQAVAWLKEHHVECINAEPREMEGGRYNFFFRGPSGEKLELFQE